MIALRDSKDSIAPKPECQMQDPAGSAPPPSLLERLRHAPSRSMPCLCATLMRFIPHLAFVFFKPSLFSHVISTLNCLQRRLGGFTYNACVPALGTIEPTASIVTCDLRSKYCGIPRACRSTSLHNTGQAHVCACSKPSSWSPWQAGAEDETNPVTSNVGGVCERECLFCRAECNMTPGKLPSTTGGRGPKRFGEKERAYVTTANARRIRRKKRDTAPTSRKVKESCRDTRKCRLNLQHVRAPLRTAVHRHERSRDVPLPATLGTENLVDMRQRRKTCTCLGVFLLNKKHNHARIHVLDSSPRVSAWPIRAAAPQRKGPEEATTPLLF